MPQVLMAIKCYSCAVATEKVVYYCWMIRLRPWIIRHTQRLMLLLIDVCIFGVAVARKLVRLKYASRCTKATWRTVAYVLQLLWCICQYFRLWSPVRCRLTQLVVLFMTYSIADLFIHVFCRSLWTRGP